MRVTRIACVALLAVTTALCLSPVDASEGDMGVNITATNEYRRAGQGARILPWSPLWTNQSAAEGKHTPIPPGMSSHKLRSQAGPLGKATDHNFFGRDACRFNFGHQIG